MKKFRIAALVLALSLLLTGCAFFGGQKKIGKDAALQAALADAGLERSKVVDVSTELERGGGSTWYEVEFESGPKEYDYKIDAYTGEILSARTE